MSAQALTVLLVLDEGIEAAPIEDALPAGTRTRTADVSHLALGGPVLGDAQADIIVVGSAGDSEGALAVIEAAARQRPDRPIVALHVGSPNGFMEKAFSAGADDLIPLPLPRAELAFALEKAIARRRGGTAPRQATATMITVLGPKGGTGKTLTSCNLAVALAMRGERPVIVDLDLQFGDIGLALGIRPERTIYDLAVSGGSLDADKAEGYVSHHETGARALLAPLRPDQASAVQTGFLRSVFDALRARHDYVIVDTPPAFTPEVIAAIDVSSHLCMVGMLDALSLKDTKIGLETLSQMGYDPSEITLVLNRADSSVGIGQDDVERLLGRRPDVLIPSDRAVPRALTQGMTIVAAEPKSGAAKAFQELADTFISARSGAPTSAAAEEPRRRLNLLRKGAR